MNLRIEKYLEIAIDAAEAAGRSILEIYKSDDFETGYKGDDSPLTRADLASHALIMELLNVTGLPVLSEEGKAIDFDIRKTWDLFWMVDPLDGTKEFIKRNGEFTVNIALIQKGRPIMGVVNVPVSGITYYGIGGVGAFKKNTTGETEAISVSKSNQGIIIVASRSHMSNETSAFIAGYEGAELISMGSSLKLLLVAEGKAQLYPRFAPTMEWDTGAAQIILEEAGGQVIDQSTNAPLRYNKENLLNPYFVAYGDLKK
jgi:3'(2'), 5'-bisphosphate nucleotidase